MISGVLRSTDREDSRLLEHEIRVEAAYHTDEQVMIVMLFSKAELDDFLKKKELVDIICVDVSMIGGIAQAERLRRHYPKSALILLADIDMSPVAYMKPTILASALLLKPLFLEDVHRVIKEVFTHFIKKNIDEEVFLIDTREEKRRIPMHDILYFEARAKKIYACTETREFAFYDTIEHLEREVQPSFVRCHRSYLVNCACVERVMISQNRIQLKEGIVLPLSRSYRERLKQLKL